jgi:hypothetical protein
MDGALSALVRSEKNARSVSPGSRERKFGRVDWYSV